MLTPTEEQWLIVIQVHRGIVNHHLRMRCKIPHQIAVLQQEEAVSTTLQKIIMIGQAIAEAAIVLTHQGVVIIIAATRQEAVIQTAAAVHQEAAILVVVVIQVEEDLVAEEDSPY